MRRLSSLAILAIFTAGAFGQGSSNSQVSQIPDGILSGNTYTNDAVGVSYEFPNGWSATVDPKGPTNIDTRHRNGLANRCSKVLVGLITADKVEGKFESVATLLVIDPSCFRGTAFPRSLEERDTIRKIVDKLVKPFSNTPFISPFESTVRPDWSQERVIIQISGGFVINAVEGRPAAKKEPLRVNTSFKFTESNGYWVAWAFVADDVSTGKLNNVRVLFKNSAP